jgi:hypothetical protein
VYYGEPRVSCRRWFAVRLAERRWISDQRGVPGRRGDQHRRYRQHGSGGGGVRSVCRYRARPSSPNYCVSACTVRPRPVEPSRPCRGVHPHRAGANESARPSKRSPCIEGSALLAEPSGGRLGQRYMRRLAVRRRIRPRQRGCRPGTNRRGWKLAAGRHRDGGPAPADDAALPVQRPRASAVTGRGVGPGSPGSGVPRPVAARCPRRARQRRRRTASPATSGTVGPPPRAAR